MKNVIFVKNFMVSDEILEKRKRVADYIRDKRILIGLTQEELAEKIGFQRNTIARIENYRFSPNADQLYSICLVLNIKLKLDDTLI